MMGNYPVQEFILFHRSIIIVYVDIINNLLQVNQKGKKKNSISMVNVFRLLPLKQLLKADYNYGLIFINDVYLYMFESL